MSRGLGDVYKRQVKYITVVKLFFAFQRAEQSNIISCSKR
ncbi:hypothetical protein JMUB7554_27700 [Staphylococcus aureus]